MVAGNGLIENLKKIEKDQYAKIKYLFASGITRQQLADLYNVSNSTIQRIVYGYVS